MLRVALRMGAATAVFAVVHSLLASDSAKARAGRVVGLRARDGGYRFAYNAQSLVATALLVGYALTLPKQPIYRLSGPPAALLRGIQGAGLIWAYLAAREIGVLRVTGIQNLLAMLRGMPVPPGPAAQGPERQDDGRLGAGGPFRWSRHPLNLAPLPIFWCTPQLTSRRLGFNVVGTLYLVLGSLHEEHRLRSRYGAEYDRYRRSGVPFYLPLRLGLPSSKPTDAPRISP